MAEVADSGGVASRKCGIHAGREAAARCPSCGGFFCRECITEHDYKMICAGCLAGLLEGREEEEKKRGKAGWAGPVVTLLQAMGGIGIVWFSCFAIAELLRELPPELHSGSMFEEIMMEAQRAALDQYDG